MSRDGDCQQHKVVGGQQIEGTVHRKVKCRFKTVMFNRPKLHANCYRQIHVRSGVNGADRVSPEALVKA